MNSTEDYTERLVAQAPLTIRRRVIWGECDPAGVVYTPRFADYAASAATWFIRVVARPGLGDAVGTPMKAMTFEFFKTMKPDEVFDMVVFVTAIRERTFDLRIDARGLDGDRRFSATMTPILIERATFKSVAIPDSCRKILAEYKDNHQ